MLEAEPPANLSKEQQDALFQARAIDLAQQTFNVVRALLDPRADNSNNPINYDNAGNDRREVLQAVLESELLRQRGEIKPGRRRVKKFTFQTSHLSCTVSMEKKDADPPSGERGVQVELTKVKKNKKKSVKFFLLANLPKNEAQIQNAIEPHAEAELEAQEKEGHFLPDRENEIFSYRPKGKDKNGHRYEPVTVQAVGQGIIGMRRIFICLERT